MANLKSAKDRIKTNYRDTIKNTNFKSEIKTLIKTSIEAAAKKEKDSELSLRKTLSRIDSAVSKGIIKKQSAARKKSRLMKQINKLKTAKN